MRFWWPDRYEPGWQFDIEIDSDIGHFYVYIVVDIKNVFIVNVVVVADAVVKFNVNIKNYVLTNGMNYWLN